MPAKKVTAKKAAGKAVKKAAVNTKAAAILAQSDQSAAQVKEGLETYAKETTDGKAYNEAAAAMPAPTETELKLEAEASKELSSEAAPAKPVKKAAAKKAPAKKAPAKKAAAKTVDDSDQAPAEIKAGLEVNAVETADGKAYNEAAAAMPAPTEAEIKEEAAASKELSSEAVPAKPVKKTAAKKAPAKKAPAKKAAAKTVDDSDQTPAEIKAGLEVNAVETKDGKAYNEAAAAMPAPTEAEIKEEAAASKELSSETAPAKPVKKTAAKKAPAKKTQAKKAAAKTVDGSDQTPAEIKAGLEAYAVETKDGKAYNEAVAAMPAPTEAEIKEEAAASKELSSLAPEQASRAALAGKAGRKDVQKVLAAASAKTVVKPVKKAVKKKAAATVKPAAVKTYENVRYASVPEVEGEDYAVTLEKYAAQAAHNARTALAAKAKAAKSAPKEVWPNEEKAAFYDTFALDTLLEMAQTLGFDMDMETLKGELSHAKNIHEWIEEAVKDLKDDKGYTFEADGFDATVIPYMMRKVADTLPYRVEDHAEFAQKVEKDINRMLINEGINDSAIYNDLFDDVRNVLMFAQHNDIRRLQDVQEQIPTDLRALIDRFMTVGRTMLPGWQYDDVKYYEGFLFGLLSQFEDLNDLHNRAMMDVADLYILHGDYGKGDNAYRYVLRENQLKDQIYFRFADVYVPFDLQKAKSIASEATRFVDGRYDYYPRIIEILNK